MKKKLIIALTMLITVLGLNHKMDIKAIEDNPEYLITSDYIIINYVKYDLIGNKIKYDGLEYELVNGALIAYDTTGIPNIIVLPVEENRIKDENVINELNSQIGIFDITTKAVPSQTKKLPYSATVPKGQWNTQSPAVIINTQTQIGARVTTLAITKMPSTASKRFSVGFTYGDLTGNWYQHNFVKDQDFGVQNYIRYQNFSTTNYGIFTISCLVGTPGFTYTITKGS